jgi:hypothetical protein
MQCFALYSNRKAGEQPAMWSTQTGGTMRICINPSSVKLWLSSNDTYEWAHRDGHAWPGSSLIGRRLFAEFDSNGLCDLTIDGKSGDCDVNELNAITSDFLKSKLPTTHPAYLIAVGQFDDGWIVPE